MSLTRLDGPVYGRGARLATEGAAVTGRWRRARFTALHLTQVPSYARLLWQLPIVTLRFTDAQRGRRLADRLMAGSWRRAASHAVLRLPATEADYLRGRSRQAVRTNVRRGRALGIECVRVHGPRSWGGEDFGLRQGAELWEGRLDGQVVCHARVIVDTEVALLDEMVSRGDPGVTCPARYLLHTEIVRALIERRVSVLVLEAVLGAPAGHKYFAARLGYEACRVGYGRPLAGPSVGGARVPAPTPVAASLPRALAPAGQERRRA